MQERYLFRGKRLDNGKWVVGLPSRRSYDGPEITAILLDDWFETDIGAMFNHSEPIDPSTIGQCTGERDKTGSFIYEGDILFDGELYYAVDWLYGCWWIIPSNGLVIDHAELATCALEYFEVVGNVHDNPAMFEEKR